MDIDDSKICHTAHVLYMNGNRIHGNWLVLYMGNNRIGYMMYVDDSRICNNGHLLYMADSVLLGNWHVLCVWIAREFYSNW